MSDDRRLTHLDESGAARMVDVGAKPASERRAVARARVRMSPGLVEVVAEARSVGRTGVEIEAMTAAAVAALAVYDMVEGVERGAAIEDVVLLSKSGGKQDWARPEAG